MRYWSYSTTFRWTRFAWTCNNFYNPLNLLKLGVEFLQNPPPLATTTISSFFSIIFFLSECLIFFFTTENATFREIKGAFFLHSPAIRYCFVLSFLNIWVRLQFSGPSPQTLILVKGRFSNIVLLIFYNILTAVYFGHTL